MGLANPPGVFRDLLNFVFPPALPRPTVEHWKGNLSLFSKIRGSVAI